MPGWGSDWGANWGHGGSAPPIDLPPVARLTISTTSFGIPFVIMANASTSTDTDVTPIASYLFDFGDGTAPVGPQPGATLAHTYFAPGDFIVTVTVTDTIGQSSQATASVHVVPAIAVYPVDITYLKAGYGSIFKKATV